MAYVFTREPEVDYQKLLYVLADSYTAMTEAMSLPTQAKPSYLISHWEQTFERFNCEMLEWSSTTQYTSAHRDGKLVMYGVASVIDDRFHKTAGFYREYNNSKTWVISREFWTDYIKYAKSLGCNRISADILARDINGQPLAHWETMLLVGPRLGLPYTAEINDDNVGLWTLYFNEDVHRQYNPHLYD